VTITSTNGTVFLEINGTNYTANNVTTDVYNVSVSLTNGTYTYRWHSWGNGTLTNYNTSVTRSYTVNDISDTCSPSSPLTGNYQFECSDNCVQSTVLDAGNYDITWNGSGTFTASVNINNIGNWFVRTGCQVIINSGVKFGSWEIFIKSFLLIE